MKRLLPFLFSLALSLSFFSCQPAPAPVDSPALTVEQFDSLATNVEALWSDQNYDMIATLYADGFQRLSPNGNQTGAEELKAFIEAFAASFPDMTITVDRNAVIGKNGFATTWTFTGTNTGPLEGGMPATGKAVTVSGVAVSTVADGKVTKEMVYFDQLDFNQQLGFTLQPPMPATEEGAPMK